MSPSKSKSVSLRDKGGVETRGLLEWKHQCGNVVLALPSQVSMGLTVNSVCIDTSMETNVMTDVKCPICQTRLGFSCYDCKAKYLYTHTHISAANLGPKNFSTGNFPLASSNKSLAALFQNSFGEDWCCTAN